MARKKSMMFMAFCICCGVTISSVGATLKDDLLKMVPELQEQKKQELLELEQYKSVFLKVLGHVNESSVDDDGKLKMMVTDLLGVTAASNRFDELCQYLHEAAFPSEILMKEFGQRQMSISIPFSLFDKKTDLKKFTTKMKKTVVDELHHICCFLNDVRARCQYLPTDKQVLDFEAKAKAANRSPVQYIEEQNEVDKSKLYLFYILQHYSEALSQIKAMQSVDPTMPTPNYAVFFRFINLWQETIKNQAELDKKLSDNWSTAHQFFQQELVQKNLAYDFSVKMPSMAEFNNQINSGTADQISRFCVTWLYPMQLPTDSKLGPEKSELEQALKAFRTELEISEVNSQWGAVITTIIGFLEKSLRLQRLRSQSCLWARPLDQLKKIASEEPLQPAEVEYFLWNVYLKDLQQLTEQQREDMGFDSDSSSESQQQDSVKNYLLQILRGEAHLTPPFDQHPFFRYVVLPAAVSMADQLPSWWPHVELLSNSDIFTKALTACPKARDVIYEYVIDNEKESSEYAVSLQDYLEMMKNDKQKSILVIDGEVNETPTFRSSFVVLTTTERLNRFHYLDPAQFCLTVGANFPSSPGVWAFDVPQGSLDELWLCHPSQLFWIEDIFKSWLKHGGCIRLGFPANIKFVESPQELASVASSHSGQKINDSLWVIDWGSSSCTFWTTKRSVPGTLNFFAEQIIPWLNKKFNCKATFSSWADIAGSTLASYLSKAPYILTLTKS